MTTRSQRLVSAILASSGGTPQFVVPSNTVVLVKSAMFYNESTAGINVVIGVFRAPGSVNFNLAGMTVPANSFGSWSGWFVCHPGDAIYGYSYGGPMQVWISGATLYGGPLYGPADA